MSTFELAGDGRIRYRDRSGSDTTWMLEAACRGLDTALFFAERGEPTREAKETCRACSVRAECLAYALDNGEIHGLWGGRSEKQRRTMRRRRGTGVAS